MHPKVCKSSPQHTCNLIHKKSIFIQITLTTYFPFHIGKYINFHGKWSFYFRFQNGKIQQNGNLTLKIGIFIECGGIDRDFFLLNFDLKIDWKC
jgi:hypothetical protein